VAAKFALRRLHSCMRHCQSTRYHAICLAHCIAKTSTVSRLPVDVNSPAVSARSPWRTGTLRSRLRNCREHHSDQAGPPCDDMDPAGVDSVQIVDGWPTSPQSHVSVAESSHASKRGYNDVVDLCIAYNCAHVIPGSLQFMRCIRQFNCM